MLNAAVSSDWQAHIPISVTGFSPAFSDCRASLIARYQTDEAKRVHWIYSRCLYLNLPGFADFRTDLMSYVQRFILCSFVNTIKEKPASMGRSGGGAGLVNEIMNWNDLGRDLDSKLE